MSKCPNCSIQVESVYHRCVMCKRNKDGEHKCSMCAIDELKCKCKPLTYGEMMAHSNAFKAIQIDPAKLVIGSTSIADAKYEEQNQVVN